MAMNAVMDADGKAINQHDLIEVNGEYYAVVGLTEVCGQNVVVLGEIVQHSGPVVLAYPWAWPAEDCWRVDF